MDDKKTANPEIEDNAVDDEKIIDAELVEEAEDADDTEKEVSETVAERDGDDAPIDGDVADSAAISDEAEDNADVSDVEDGEEDAPDQDADAESTESASEDQPAEVDLSEEVATAAAASEDAALADEHNPAETDADTPEPEATEEDHEVVYEEVTQRSWAMTALIILVLLIAGAAGGIWAAPKIAPSLPAGMSSLAAFLTPGQSSAMDEIKALEARIDAKLAAQDTGLTPEGVTAEISSSTAELGDTLSAGISELSQKVDAVSDQVAAADSPEIEARLAATEAQLAGIAAELGSLRNDLSGLADFTGAMSAETSALSEQASELAEAAAARNAAKIAVYQAEIEGLRAELAALAAQNGALAQRVDEVEVTTERKLSEAEAEIAEAEAETQAKLTDAGTQSALTEIAAALDTGAGFGPSLRALSDAGLEVPAALRKAQKGVPTADELLTQFPDLAHKAIRDSIRAANEGDALSRLGGFLQARVAGRSLTEIEGNTPDAILSRVEARLKEGKLAKAATEAEALPSPAQAVMADWLGALNARLEATAAFSELKSELNAR